jgi:sulfur relay (sulfurtransferase) complex TusBCD TusD component (DsrE family)
VTRAAIVAESGPAAAGHGLTGLMRIKLGRPPRWINAGDVYTLPENAMRFLRSLARNAIAAALIAAPVVAGCALLGALPAQAQQAEAQQVVVHLGSFTNDLHSAFMALSLATNMQKAGASVTVFLDREGVRLADRTERGDLTWGDSGAISTAMDGFVGAGGKVLACPHCAELAGVAAANLRAGARLGTHEEVARLMLDADKVIDF